MKFWIIGWKDVVIRLRDRRGFLILILMPLVLTLILGSALSGVMSNETVSMPHMTVAVYDGDAGGSLSKTLTDDVLKSASLQKYLTVHAVPSPEEVEQTVYAGRADAGIVIPARFTERIVKGQQTQIDVVQDSGKPTSASIVQSIVTSFTDRASTVVAATNQVMTDRMRSHQNLGKWNPVDSDYFKMTQFLTQDIQQVSEHPNVFVSEQPVGAKALSAKQYYAAGMAVMFLLFNATIGAKLIINERDAETLARMMCTPASKTSILLGKFVGTLIFAVLQFLVLLVATRFVFGVDWGSNLWQLGSIVVSYAIAVSGLSMTIASVTTSAQNADTIAQVFVQIFSILGGSMVPLSVFPDLMRKIALITPNAWALTSLTNIMTDTSWQSLLLPIGVLLAIGAVALSVGTWRLQAVRR